MSLLTREQRRQLEGLLMRLPNINDAGSRNLLLVDLPQDLTRTIAFDAAAGTHVANIVNAVNNDEWRQLPDGMVPLLVVIENAIDIVRGSGLAAELQSFHIKIEITIKSGNSTPAPSDTTPPSVPTPNTQTSSPTISLTNLTGSQRRQLYNALLSAFPTIPDLARMARFGLNENLASIAGGGGLSDTVLNLMTWAQAHGRMEELVRAALDDNPGSPDLQAFGKAAGLVP